jgi:hypothetical protein
MYNTHKHEFQVIHICLVKQYCKLKLKEVLNIGFLNEFKVRIKIYGLKEVDNFFHISSFLFNVFYIPTYC